MIKEEKKDEKKNTPLQYIYIHKYKYIRRIDCVKNFFTKKKKKTKKKEDF